jgi:hypothetical protein
MEKLDHAKRVIPPHRISRSVLRIEPLLNSDTAADYSWAVIAMYTTDLRPL